MTRHVLEILEGERVGDRIGMGVTSREIGYKVVFFFVFLRVPPILH